MNSLNHRSIDIGQPKQIRYCRAVTEWIIRPHQCRRHIQLAFQKLMSFDDIIDRCPIIRCGFVRHRPRAATDLEFPILDKSEMQIFCRMIVLTMKSRLLPRNRFLFLAKRTPPNFEETDLHPRECHGWMFGHVGDHIAENTVRIVTVFFDRFEPTCKEDGCRHTLGMESFGPQAANPCSSKAFPNYSRNRKKASNSYLDPRGNAERRILSTLVPPLSCFRYIVRSTILRYVDIAYHCCHKIDTITHRAEIRTRVA